MTLRTKPAWFLIGFALVGVLAPSAHAEDLADLLCGLNVLHRELATQPLSKSELKALQQTPTLIPNVESAVRQLKAAGKNKKAEQLLENAALWIDRIKDERLKVSMADLDAAFRLRCLR